MRTKKMWEMTWPEVQEAIENGMGVMLPVGAIEQHGCHLPLVTDTIIPTRLCTEIAENTNMIVAGSGFLWHLFQTTERRRTRLHRNNFRDRHHTGSSG